MMHLNTLFLCFDFLLLPVFGLLARRFSRERMMMIAGARRRSAASPSFGLSREPLLLLSSDQIRIGGHWRLVLRPLLFLGSKSCPFFMPLYSHFICLCDRIAALGRAKRRPLLMAFPKNRLGRERRPFLDDSRIPRQLSDRTSEVRGC